MCTAVTYTSCDRYFGRNLDMEFSYNETVTVTPSNFPLHFRHLPSLTKHYTMIGIAYVVSDYPLYYDAVNEKGLAVAGLRFTAQPKYSDVNPAKENLASFEVIPWILGQCASVPEVCKLLNNINIVNTAFSKNLPNSPLHWMIADKTCSVVLERSKLGVHIFKNPVGVLTNNPGFEYQIQNLNNYMSISAYDPKNNFSKSLEFDTFSRGMGALGLPGDMSSVSRFVRAAFIRHNSISGSSESESISQFFHILSSVAQYRGCVILPNGQNEITRYSSCMNLNKCIYYYKTYENSSITEVDMKKEYSEQNHLINFPLITDQQIKQIN